MRIVCICVFLFLSLSVEAQVDSTQSYFYWRNQGLTSIQAGNFDYAINCFKLARVLDDAPVNSDIEVLIDSAYGGYTRQLESSLLSNQALLLEKVQEEIYELEFDEAEKILNGLGEVKVGKEKVLRHCAELIFFYTEAEKPAKAWPLFEQAEPLFKSTPTFQDSDTLAYLTEVLKIWLPADLLEKIHYRYYPKMVFVEGGEFTYQKGEESENDTTINSFYIGQTEVTVWQYYLFTVSIDSVMAQKPGWGYAGDNPTINVNWFYANQYLLWLSQKTGESYRLPYEVEWEFAACGGNNSKGFSYSGSNDRDSVAWYYYNSGFRTHPVAIKNPNELGLYDMSGNVWEWCQNWYSAARLNRVLRGGAWSFYARYLRASVRFFSYPDYRNNNTGFRIVRNP